MKYCVDANFFISLWRRYYSIDIVPSFWEWLAKQAKKMELIVPEEVFEEVIINNDGLSSWLRDIKQCVLYSLNDDVQKELQEIISLPSAIRLIDSNKKNHSADVFLVAYAKTYKATVVSDDTGVQKLCQDCEVNVIRYDEFIKEKGLKMVVQE